MKTGDSFNLNLLPSQAKFQAARTKLQGIMRRYMAVAIVIWILVTIVTMVVFYTNDLVLKSENKKYQQALTSFKGMSDEIVLSQLIKYRIKVLGQVMKDRFEYSTAFEKIASVFSGEVKLAKFEIDKEKNFSVVVAATNKAGVDFVEDKVVEANAGKVEGVASINITNVDYVIADKSWNISMGVKLSK